MIDENAPECELTVSPTAKPAAGKPSSPSAYAPVGYKHLLFPPGTPTYWFWIKILACYIFLYIFRFFPSLLCSARASNDFSGVFRCLVETLPFNGSMAVILLAFIMRTELPSKKDGLKNCLSVSCFGSVFTVILFFLGGVVQHLFFYMPFFSMPTSMADWVHIYGNVQMVEVNQLEDLPLIIPPYSSDFEMIETNFILDLSNMRMMWNTKYMVDKEITIKGSRRSKYTYNLVVTPILQINGSRSVSAWVGCWEGIPKYTMKNRWDFCRLLKNNTYNSSAIADALSSTIPLSFVSMIPMEPRYQPKSKIINYFNDEVESVALKYNLKSHPNAPVLLFHDMATEKNDLLANILGQSFLGLAYVIIVGVIIYMDVCKEDMKCTTRCPICLVIISYPFILWFGFIVPGGLVFDN